MSSVANAPLFHPVRHRIVRWGVILLVRVILRLRVEGREHLDDRPVLYCFNHPNWSDTGLLLAVLPPKPPLMIFGPREDDMSRGLRNRFITWAGIGVPYKPSRTNLIDTTRRVQREFEAGRSLAIAPEGRIHRGERQILPLEEGVAYFALRCRVPIVPVAINGNTWLGFRRSVRIRIGPPIEPGGRPTREAVASLTARTADALRSMVRDYPDPPPPGPFGRWLTELFNDWPEGARPELTPDMMGEPTAEELREGSTAGG